MSRVLRCVAVGVVAALAGCDGDLANAERRVPPAEKGAKPGVLPVKTAVHPASPCDWIPASEVEAVVGKLSEPPRKQEGGCFYPLPRAGMKSDWPAEPEDTAGVLIQVDVGVGAEERPAELAFATAGSWVGN